MFYIVEVTLDTEHLARELSQMRTWLDHMKFQALGFRHVGETKVCRIDFEAEQEARAFARAFAGRLLSRTAA